ncbi:MAG TPA: biotin--[acetyl-CoA-carboxylase] synthetase, partial [Methanocellaceae archaeon]
ALLVEFERQYHNFNEEQFEVILNEYKGMTYPMGSHVIVKYQDKLYEGISVDVNEDGAFVMKTNDGSVMTFVTGDVHAHPDETFKKDEIKREA